MRITNSGMRLLAVAVLTLLATAFPFSLPASETNQVGTEKSLADTILALDKEFFAAFNSCNLEKWRRYLAVDIEFYQDNDDVTTTRRDLEPSFLDRCDSSGHAAVQRELLLDSVEVYPIQGYGAVQFGTHQFWIMLDDGGRQLGSTPRFVHLWRNKDGVWQITRVISYGHTVPIP